MTNPLLNAAIMKIVSRLDPVPVRIETLRAEVDIALAEPITTIEFDAALSQLRRRAYLAVGEDPLLGCRTAALTAKGRKEAARL